MRSLQPHVRSVFGILACFAMLCALSPARGWSDATSPNVVLVVADDLGFADVGYQGAIDFDTPHLDALAESGVEFTAGYVTHPYCSPSRAGIMTGRYQQRFGHEHNPPFEPENEAVGTPTDEVSLSQVLGEAGYRTHAIGKWHLGDHPRFNPVRRGFDTFFGFSGGGFNYYGEVPRNSRRQIVRGLEPAAESDITYLTDDFTREAVEIIERSEDQPFFIYLAYNAVHAPNQAPQRYLKQTRHIEDGFRSVYAAMMIAMDEGIGRVVRALEETDQRQDTLVFFVNDNGGRIGSDNRPLRGHKGMLYEGGIRVPMIASWPGSLPAGSDYDHPVSALDIFPTCAAAAGASTESCKPLDGVNLLPYLTGRNETAPHETLYWRVIGGQGYAVRHGDWKLVQPAATDAIELYDLAKDLREENDLSDEKPEVVARLQQLYESWDAQLRAPLWSDPHGENVQKEFNAVYEARQRALPPSQRD